MDWFKEKNTREATALDLYCPYVCYDRKVKKKDKQMIRRLSRRRLRRELQEERSWQY